MKNEIAKMIQSLLGSRRGIIWLLNELKAIVLIIIFLVAGKYWETIIVFCIGLVYAATYVRDLTWEKIQTNINVGVGR